MKKVNIFEVKARLSEYLDMVERGEQVVICRRNQPVAELRAVTGIRSTDRPLGGTDLEVPGSFFERLPVDLEDAFYGQPPAAGGRGKVAENREGSYGPTRRSRRRKRS